MMYRLGTFASIGLLCALATACSIPTHAMLTYQSVPDGAEIFENGKSLGTVPVTRTYTGDANATNIKTPDVTAIWASGAKTTYFTLLPPNADLVATLERPADAPGLQQDMDVAAKHKRNAEHKGDADQSQLRELSIRCQKEKQNPTLGVPQDCN